MKKPLIALAALTLPFVVAAQTTSLSPNVLLYGTENVLGTGTYPSDPTAGATLVGLAADSVTFATLIQGHGYPFLPAAGDYPGTDQIYVGQNQTGSHDGYSSSGNQIAGPQVVSFDYSSLVPAGSVIDTLTLGIAADDFQFPFIGNPFSATVNGTADAALSATLNSLDQSGPLVQLFTIGIDPAALNSSNILTLSINEGGDGGDGWAVDYFTIGVTTSPVPEPSSWCLLVAGIGAWAALRRQSSRA